MMTKMETIEKERLHRQLIKKFHCLLGKAGIDNDGKLAILSGYGVMSSKQLSNSALIEVCDKIASLGNPRDQEMNALRRRVMASIGGYLRLMGKDESAQLIQGIACRIAGCEDFNRIPAERLRNIYYTFLNKQKDIKVAGDTVNAVLIINRNDQSIN
jgi:hypothetical protein